MIKPSIGRVVWFHPSHPHDQPYAALVTYVHSDRMVNLGGFDPNGAAFAETSVTILQDDDVAPTGGRFCEWMPYQIGQAKKHEADAAA